MTEQEQREFVDKWLQYIGAELAVGSPGMLEPPLVKVQRTGHDSLEVRIGSRWARIALISCGDDAVPGGQAIFPAVLNLTPIGDGRWK